MRKNFQRESSATGNGTVLGGSDYWPKRIDYLQRLKYCLQDFDDIRVFFCLRKADDFAESLYATKALSIKTGFAGSFEDFLIDAAGNFEYAQHYASFAKFSLTSTYAASTNLSAFATYSILASQDKRYGSCEGLKELDLD